MWLILAIIVAMACAPFAVIGLYFCSNEYGGETYAQHPELAFAEEAQDAA